MDFPFSEKRPWGEFRQFTNNSPVTVKIISVRSGQSLSLQYHLKRQEFWVVLNGEPEITIGEKTFFAKKGEEFSVEKEVKHRLAAPRGDVEILEISSGDFEESDIVRLEDIYERV